MAEQNEKLLGETPELAAVKDAIMKYDQTGSEHLGFGLAYLAERVERAGEQGYTALVQRLAKDGDFGLQRWILDAGEKWLNRENAQHLLAMKPRDFEIEQHAGILFALKWDIAGERIMYELSTLLQELDRIEQSVELDAAQKTERANNITDVFGGSKKLRMFGTALGLAYMGADADARARIFDVLEDVAAQPRLRPFIAWGLREAIPFSKGKSPYRFSYYDPGDRWEYPPPSAKIPGLKFPAQPEQYRRDLAGIWKIFAGEDIQSMPEWHRTITKEMFRDPMTGQDVPTIIKQCNRAIAEKENRNLELLAQWGFPVPKVYEINECGIRVQDLSENGERELIMDDFRHMGDALHFVANEKELREELDRYVRLLKSRGVDIEKLERVIGVVVDKVTGNGKIYFADADHITLGENDS